MNKTEFVHFVGQYIAPNFAGHEFRLQYLLVTFHTDRHEQQKRVT